MNDATAADAEKEKAGVQAEAVASAESLKTATFATGCFWCTEAVFERLQGVKSVVSGYTGGEVKNPTYSQVCGGQTGHAEAVQVKFDPKQISYEALLDMFWRSHDPTSLNRQGADVGTQYRSAIFYHDQAQREAALKSREALERSGRLGKAIVTEIEPAGQFYRAEPYHQDYFRLNPNAPYCRYVIAPKLEKLGSAGETGAD